jgi:hypothetical protein
VPITEPAVMQNDNNEKKHMDKKETNRESLYNLRLFKCKYVSHKSVDSQTALAAEAHLASGQWLE